MTAPARMLHNDNFQVQIVIDDQTKTTVLAIQFLTEFRLLTSNVSTNKIERKIWRMKIILMALTCGFAWPHSSS